MLSENESLAVDEREIIEDGIRDVGNQYAFAVMTKASVQPKRVLKCSGVYIGPRLVLTAGHCVCSRRKATELQGEAASVIDASSCAGEATVAAVFYFPRQESSQSPARTEARLYQGKVSVHPELKVLLDAQAQVVSTHADLALIFLQEEVESEVQVVRMAESEAKAGESIVLAGYGHDGVTHQIYGVRRSGKKRVTKASSGGRDEILFEAGGELAFTSGSGEPCLRQEGEVHSLLGISGPSNRPACTSVRFHRDWLLSEAQRER